MVMADLSTGRGYHFLYRACLEAISVTLATRQLHGQKGNCMGDMVRCCADLELVDRVGQAGQLVGLQVEEPQGAAPPYLRGNTLQPIPV